MMPASFTAFFLQATPAPVVPVTYWGLTFNEWVTVVALILGPVVAVVTQLWWQHRKQRRDQKLNVFGTLMSMRAFNLTPEFVKALNFIDVVFYKNKAVRNKWAALLKHLSSDAFKAVPIAPATFERTRDLLAELLVEMAKDLGFGYDFTHIKDNAYIPQALVNVDTELSVLRQKLIAALDGKGVLTVKLVEEAPAPPAK